MKISNLARDFILASKKADNNILIAFQKTLKSFENDFKSRAPVDSRAFKESWRSSQISGNDTLTAQIHNSSEYAGAIEFGSSPGRKPWPNPGPKTEMSGGRIYSSQAVGGTIDKVFNEKTMEYFALTIAKSILRAFK